MEFFDTIFGILCLISFIVVIYVTARSRKAALEEIEQRLNADIKQRQLINEDAVRLARDFFSSFDHKAYRKYADFVIPDASLPIMVNAETTKMFFIGFFMILFLGWPLVGGIGSEGVILNGIPIPGFILQILFLGIILMFVAVMVKAWLHRKSSLSLDKESLQLHLGDKSFQLDYGSFQLLVIPANKRFTIELISNEERLTGHKKIMNIFPPKTVVPILVVKAIEHGTFTTAIGSEL